ncbi:putative ATP-dependent RNA helicase DDX11-like protein 8 [Hypsibius exemplaris]|uniref:ATP-dependent RNA helicase DDX11-like protein 8 n=1 Tax=Hypsibius exemplaris TaxID=2072580 RepID=A0A9X6NEU9_HYPEX|nr:putative ATP-dependent RNA helicase DDX11-like protein 8 [Hypsibius exemplaris]
MASKNDTQASVAVSAKPLRCPEHFPFPFEPYPIQVDFMRNIFSTIEESKIGIFESPTGTGKSLSIICGSLTWLREYKDNMTVSLQDLREQEKAVEKSSASSTDWLSADYETFKLKEKLKAQRTKIESDLQRELQWKKRREKLAEKRKAAAKKGDEALSESDANMRSIEKILKEARSGQMADLPDAHLMPDEYESDEESPLVDANADTEHVRKIYYCTRTHSQITQFIKELKRSSFGSSTRVSALASRQNLCVFEPVRQLRSQRLMNDRCVELQKGKSNAKPTAPLADATVGGGQKRRKRDPQLESSCPYYQKENIETLSTQILNEVLDIEESAKAGTETLGCPYYASRLALPDAEVVAVPYNLILHRPTREASGIQLKDQIVIIDEAHNLLDAIAGMYSAEITQRQVRKASSQLSQYHERYRTRLTPKNTLYIKQLILVLKKLLEVFQGLPAETADAKHSTPSKVFTMDSFLLSAKLESVNLFKILAYCKRSLISRKLSSYAEFYADPTSITGLLSSSQTDDGSPSSPLMVIEGFLETLTNANTDGRIVLSADTVSGGKLKFLLLNPAVYVSDIFQSARSVIFAGGTMRPVSDFEDQLLTMAGVAPSRVHKFACGHVVSPDNILPIALQSSPNGLKFEFNYMTRNTMIPQLGCLLSNLCNIVPGGIVCFLCSYEYEELVFTTFTKPGCEALKNIQRKKVVFREPKKSSDVEGVLTTYARAVKHPVGALTGAILFAVVGGKLSEGINFSDELGRCVVMVGLPYPSTNSPELQEKMKFLDSKLPGKQAGKAHYEGLCMKAVNQSIGRAIRHKDDYAVILLVDNRYAAPSINRALPEWIGDRLTIAPKFGDAFGSIRRFFSGKANKTGLTLDA